MLSNMTAVVRIKNVAVYEMAARRTREYNSSSVERDHGSSGENDVDSAADGGSSIDKYE